MVPEEGAPFELSDLAKGVLTAGPIVKHCSPTTRRQPTPDPPFHTKFDGRRGSYMDVLPEDNE